MGRLSFTKFFLGGRMYIRRRTKNGMHDSEIFNESPQENLINILKANGVRPSGKIFLKRFCLSNGQSILISLRPRRWINELLYACFNE